MPDETHGERPYVPPFPLFLHLEGAPVCVIGGGEVAERKVESLLAHGAAVTVIAPLVSASIRDWARAGRIAWTCRRYRPGDLEGALLVVCAVGNRAVDEEVHAEAQRRCQLVNVVDVPHLCNVIVPSVLRRGRLQIAVSTGGASPSAAREVRKSLEAEFPAFWEEYLDLVAEVRRLVKERVPGPAAARTPLYEALQASDLLQRIAAGERADAESVYARVVAPLLDGEAS